MFCASWASTCLPRRQVFGCFPVLQKEKSHLKLFVGCNVFLDMSATDIFTSHPVFRKHLGALKTQPQCHGKIAHGLSSVKEKRVGSLWKYPIQIARKTNFKGWSLDKKQAPLIKAVATVEPKYLVPTENDNRYDSMLKFCSNSDSQLFQISNDESSEIDDKERLRRMKISKANKGNVPWNKGRKHSAATLQRIRERTRIAMQDPKVKMKLVNLGHRQSEETRIKIGAGVRQGWRRRREKLMLQESCFIEWQNMIAEAARKGYAGEDELQWDSYRILDEQLKQEWLENVEKRKMMPRPKGSKRAPKSLEQRRKISEAIFAKWADPEYRERVCTALAKYHATAIGAERKRRRRPTGKTPLKMDSVEKKLTQSKSIRSEAKSIQKTISKRKRTPTPYKDPMAGSKLEMIKRIRARRVAMETKKRKAVERAKLLIAEAEKAAKALEMAALRSPLAQASLMETRKLIAEATRSMEKIENGQLTLQDVGDDASLSSVGPINHLQINRETQSNDKFLDEQLNALNGREPLTAEKCTENSSDATCGYLSSQSRCVRKESETNNLQADQLTVNGSVRYDDPAANREEWRTSELKESESSTKFVTKTKKKWVHGKLLEVEED
ncbi:uncharacterized protein LOC103697567 isoform X2 [Phoenix dactylifera]|uniref:Uncharacterized protein LOC103697567 isoform X2 n=1 Tax=Phoenix dactylifera TaxID=42345 RepID=A0A8B8ZKP5_PHODC|nr:uncharacterized protein LOC103697567 isoform X2 [Phoenix dactylifera]